MSPHDERLIDAFLDGTITERQAGELNRRIHDDPQFAREFAEALYLHDRLFDSARAARDFESNGAEFSVSCTRRKPILQTIPRRWRVGGVIAASVAILIFSTWMSAGRSLKAATEIDRLIALNDVRADRVYAIRNLDRTEEPTDARQPPIDGAKLYVRNPDRYVLVRKFADGSPFVTGSDGSTSWAVPPDGAVRVSHDPERFRGPVPGHQHGLPFVDLKRDLAAFRNSYDLSGPRIESDGLRTITGNRKWGVPRGPRSFEMQYEAGSGSIRRMIFDGLPQARGGPRRVAVELIESPRLPSNFFDHQSHHGNDREVVEEE